MTKHQFYSQVANPNATNSELDAKVIITPDHITLSDVNDEVVSVNVNQAVEDFYPLLDKTQANLVAEYVNQRFDYSVIYDTIHDEITEIAYRKGIDLEDKDEPQVPPDLRLVQ